MPIKKRRNPSAQFMWTFFLGLLIGFSFGYVLRGGKPEQSPPKVSSSTNTPADERKVASNVTPALGDATKPAKPDETTKPAPDATDKDKPAVPPAAQTTTPPLTPADQQPAPVAPPSSSNPGAARHLFIAVAGTTLDDATKSLLAELKPGGVVLRDENIVDEQQTIALVAEIKQACGMGEGFADLPLIAIEQDGGPINRLKLSKAPSPASLGAEHDASAVRGVGNAYAEACKARGISILLGPMLDVYETGADPVLQERCFGNNGPLVASLGLAFIAGVMDKGVIPVAKHFPGLGGAKSGLSETVAIIDKPARELASSVYPFSEAATRNAPGIMAGHIALPQVDKDVLRPASLSPVMLQDFLRQLWGYKGVIVSDDLNLGAITKTMKPEVAAVKALQAGCDAVLFLDPTHERIHTVVTTMDGAASAGTLKAEQMTESRARLDAWQAWLRAPKSMEGPLPAIPSSQFAESTAPAQATPEVKPEGDAATAKQEPAKMEITPVPPTEVKPVTPEPEKPAQEAAKTETPPAPAPGKSTEVAPPPGTKKVVHEIAKGELLADIAKKYGVKKDDIIAWNKLSGPELKYGKKLDIYVSETATPPEPAPAPVETKPAPVETKPAVTPAPPATETPKSAETSTPAAAEAPKPAPAETPKTDTPETKPDTPAKPKDEPKAPDANASTPIPEFHTIEEGETLTKISKKFGVSVSNLQKWNKLETGDIKFGFKLRLTAPPGEETASKDPAAKELDKAPKTVTREHTVAAGQTLQSIADSYAVDIADLKKWNAIEGDTVTEGQKLTLHLPVAAE